MIKRLSYRLAITYGLIFLLAISAIDVILIWVYSNNQFRKTEEVYTKTAVILSGVARVNFKVTEVWRNMDGRALLLDTKGVVLSDSNKYYDGRIISTPELRKVLETKKAAVGYYTLNQKKVAMFAYPVQSKGKIDRIILISTHVQEVYDEVWNFSKQIIGISLVIAAFVISISIFMGRRITEPIKKLTYASEEIFKGRIKTSVNIQRDDEIGTLAKTFNMMSEELHKVDVGRKRFVSDVSHELKTPLASVKALTESLIEGKHDEAVYKEYLSDVNIEIDRLSSLVKSLLTASRLEEIQLKLEKINLYEEIENVVKIFDPLAEEKGIKIINHGEKDITISADKAMLKEVLINLIDNAVKYGKERGNVNIKYRNENEGLVLRVKDDGYGIPEADLPFIFDNFYRVDTARTREKGGSGIGLFIVKRIIDLHGWDISVSSHVDEGAEFVIMVKNLH